MSFLINYAAADILLQIAFLIPPSTLSHSALASIFLPVIWGLHIRSWTNGYHVWSSFHILWSTDLLLFRRPREDFRLLRRVPKDSPSKVDKSGGEVVVALEPYPENFVARFWWMRKLVVSARFVGWDTGEVKQPFARTATDHEKNIVVPVWARVLGLFICAIATKTSIEYSFHDPYFKGLAGIDSPLPEIVATCIGKSLAILIPPRSLRLLVFAVQQFSLFTLISDIIIFISLILGRIGLADDFWTSPENIPPLWGNPLVVLHSGLRGLWGRFWHQLFRHMFADPGKALTRRLKIHPGSTVGYVVQILVAFFLSGALHAATLPANVPGLSPLNYAYFFWLNGVAVLIEILGSQVFKYVGMRDQGWLNIALMAVRLVWTVAVLWMTGPLLVGETAKISALMLKSHTRN